MKYGINNVVGGFYKAMTAEEAIPHVLARTFIEHRVLTLIFHKIKSLSYSKDAVFFRKAIELGCGYGRNLPLLSSYSSTVVGVERDVELFKTARKLYDGETTKVLNYSIDEYEMLPSSDFDLILTFTFLQHLSTEERQRVIHTIGRISAPRAYLIICEETDKEKSHPGCESFTVEEYSSMLEDHFRLIVTFPRLVERTFPKVQSGHFMVFQKAN